MTILRRAPASARHRWPMAICLGWLLCAALPRADAYVLEGDHWPSDQPIVMDLQLGVPGYTLIDGSTSWNQVAEAALNVWNPYLGSGVQFEGEETSYTPAQGDGKNTVFFSGTIFGEDFGSDTLGITLYYYNTSTGVTTEADVLFNSAKSFDSYRGPLRTASGGSLVYDLRRVAIHEFGHVLGLGHVPQSTQAIMTPITTDIDTVQPDDIAGVESIYGPPVHDAPKFIRVLATNGAVGQILTYQIDTLYNPTGYQASGLPAGLSIDPTTGLISGAPTTPGTYHVTLSATNDYGTSTATLTLAIYAPPVITSALTAAASFSQFFGYQVTADNQPATFSAVNLPDGLQIDGNTGIISGTPLVIGPYSVTLEATNPAGAATVTLALQVTLADPAFVTLHSFSGPDGDEPGPLIQGSDGNFYGLTNLGGSNGRGTAFRMTPDGGLTTLCDFDGFFASDVPSALVQAGDGDFYGTVGYGGDYNGGAIFRLTPDGVLTAVHSFVGSDGYAPSALVQASDGNLYGVCGTGGPANAGTIFRLTPDGTFSLAYSFDGVSGSHPSGALLQAGDGNLYGVTTGGVGSTRGSVFKMTLDGALTTLHVFAGTDGSDPVAPLVEGKDGNFYGTTADGGGRGNGTFFVLTPAGTLTTLYSFGLYDGFQPSALVQAGDGNFYGTTRANGPAIGPGAPENDGTIFQLTPGGVLTTIHSFAGPDGSIAGSALVVGRDGNLYGTTNYGGSAANDGTIFRRPPGTFQVPIAPPVATVGSGVPGTITISLSVARSTRTIVHYVLGGSAVNGKDYAPLSGKVKIRPGGTSEAVNIQPLGGSVSAARKTVKLVLMPGADYSVGDASAVKIKILAGQ